MQLIDIFEAMKIATGEEFMQECSKCGSNNNVEKRYSFGIYAGRLCESCAGTYRDKCGEVDIPFSELDEEY